MKRLLILGFVGLSLLMPQASAEDQATDKKPFPNLQMASLDGQSIVELDSFRGRPVLITFWATWCGPCRVELPELEKLYGELMGEGFVLLTVNVDNSSVAAVQFLNHTGLKVPVYRVNFGLMKKLGINAIPTNVLLDRDGFPAAVFSGYSPTVPEEIRRQVLEMGPATQDRSAGSEGGR